MDDNRSKIKPKDTKKQRKLIRSPEVTVCDIIPASVEASIVTSVASVTDVMGGGITIPYSLLANNTKNNTNFSSSSSSDSHKIISRTTELSSLSSSTNKHNLYQNQQHYNNPQSVGSSNTTTVTTNVISSTEKSSKLSSSDNVNSRVNLLSSGTGLHRNKSERIGLTTKKFLTASFKNKRIEETLDMGGDLSTTKPKAIGNINYTSFSSHTKDTKEENTTSNESSTAQPPLTRLQTFLFKTNDTTKSSNQTMRPLQQRSDPTSDYRSGAASTIRLPSDEGYYFTMTSPNNPFLPEIIAKNYNNDQTFSIDDDSVPTTIASVMATTTTGRTFSSSSSLTEQQSKQQSSSSLSSLQGHEQKSSLQESEEKIFNLCSPTKDYHLQHQALRQQSSIKETEQQQHYHHHYHHQQPHQQQQQQHQQQNFQTSDSNNTTASGSKNLNPFLCYTGISGVNSNYPSNDLNTKREEFLKATMKICLVVSPPSSKLQLKSKSLTHLDSLDSMIACHQQSPTVTHTNQKSEHLDASQQIIISSSKVVAQQQLHSPPSIHSQQQQQQHNNHHHHYHHYYYDNHHNYHQQQQQYHHQSIISSTSTCNKICCLGAISSPTTIISNTAAAIATASSISHPTLIGQTTLSTSPSSTASQGIIQKKKSSFMHRKKPILTRSEVPSSEYFSVYFCTEAGYQEEELIPATKGVTLLDALSNSLRKRNLSFSQITISDNNFQICTSDTGSPPYTSSLEENTDVENLAGKVLIVSEKDSSKKIGTLQKAASFGSRTRPPRLLSSASTEETTAEIEQKQIPGKQLKQRWSGLFGIKNPQQSQLCELLNNYAKNGVPQKTSSVNFDHPNFDMALEYLDNIHKTWRDIVNCDDMTDTDIKIQSAIWELVSTEVDYIHALQTVTDLFLACLEAIQEEKLLIDVDQNKLFSNIRDICEANLKFWTYYLYPMVDNSIKTKQPMCIDYFQPGFVTFATTFSPYKKYCAEQSTCQYYCKELNRNNALFTAYLAWCESQKMCNRLRLADILVRPMQRLTKYSLLLTAIRKHIADENDADVIDSMIHSVESFVYSVNTHLTTRQENERLKGIMARIESYDIVDSNNEQLEKLVKQYSTTLDLCAPMKGCLTNQGRHLFMEGDLKLKDNFGKADVHCFLLTDILLICKTIAKKGQGTLKVIRQPYLTDKLIVKHKDNTLYCVYLNEFQMVINAFTLQCNEAKNWNDAITKAKHIYSRLKQGSNWDSYNLRYGSSIGSNNADTLLGIKKSPLNSSIGSRVSSLNNSHSGSVELNDSRNISVDFEKTNSLSSDEGSNPPQKPKTLTSPQVKTKTSFSNTLTVQPLNHLGQSLPNLNLHPNQASNLYHTYSNNTLLVPGSTHSGNVLLSPSHRGISYPPPSPTRATLRRGFAFSSSIKNPPLVKTRNITSQSSINWHQIPATPQSSPQSSSSHQSHQQQQQQQPQQQQQSPTTVIPTQQHQQQQHSPIHMATGLQINESDV